MSRYGDTQRKGKTKTVLILRWTDPLTPFLCGNFRKCKKSQTVRSKPDDSRLTWRNEPEGGSRSRVFMYLSAEGLQGALHAGERHQRKAAVVFALLFGCWTVDAFEVVHNTYTLWSTGQFNVTPAETRRFILRKFISAHLSALSARCC